MSNLDSIIGPSAILSLDEARSLADDPDVVRRHQAELVRDMELIRASYRGAIAITLTRAHWSIVLTIDEGPVILASGVGHEAMADEITRLAGQVRQRSRI